jgi:hypothetical protein
VVETAVQQAVAVEIDQLAVERLDHAVILLGVELGDPPLLRGFVGLDRAALLAAVFLEAPACGVEGVADRHVDVLVRVALVVVPAGHGDFAVGHREIDADMVDVALSVVLVRRLDQNPAPHHRCVELFEFFGFLPDLGFDGSRRLHLPEGDFQRYAHGPSCLQ